MASMAATTAGWSASSAESLAASCNILGDSGEAVEQFVVDLDLDE